MHARLSGENLRSSRAPAGRFYKYLRYSIDPIAALIIYLTIGFVLIGIYIACMYTEEKEGETHTIVSKLQSYLLAPTNSRGAVCVRYSTVVSAYRNYSVPRRSILTDNIMLTCDFLCD